MGMPNLTDESQMQTSSACGAHGKRSLSAGARSSAEDRSSASWIPANQGRRDNRVRAGHDVVHGGQDRGRGIRIGPTPDYRGGSLKNSTAAVQNFSFIGLTIGRGGVPQNPMR